MRQVIITRSAADAAETAKLVAQCGFDPIIAPLFDISPIPHSLPSVPQEAVIATSRHSLIHLTPKECDNLRSLPLYTVGPATTATAETMGFQTIRQGTGDASGLATRIIEDIPSGAHVLFLTGDPSRPELKQALAPHFKLTISTLYHSVERTSFPADALALITDPAPFWLHFSVKSAERAVMLLKMTSKSQLFQHAHHIALSPVIAKKLVEWGGTDCTIARQPTMESLLLGLGTSADQHRLKSTPL